jgi:hypothetical protein
MRTEFRARYVRMYGWCDQNDYFDRFVSAAYAAGLGVHATIWFGFVLHTFMMPFSFISDMLAYRFDGSDKWKGRRDRILNFVRNTDYASYAIRTVDVGSEPLFDWVSILRPIHSNKSRSPNVLLKKGPNPNKPGERDQVGDLHTA